ncbi:mitochondrial carrier domain-containing protein, partial [Mycena sp. CBHHK59/15]
MNGLVFASYGFFLRLQVGGGGAADASLTQVALAGVGSGVVSAIITTPTELIKIRQQQCVGASSARGVAAGIVRAAGVRGLYRGAGATAWRDCGYGAYFAAYEATCRCFAAAEPGVARPPLNWPVLLAGGVAGVVGWLVTFPFDVVKTRVQGSGPGVTVLPTAAPLLGGSAAPSASTNPYRTTGSTIVYSYRAEGAQVFYRGLAATLISEHGDVCGVRGCCGGAGLLRVGRHAGSALGCLRGQSRV